jgi:hypothetical protein
MVWDTVMGWYARHAEEPMPTFEEQYMDVLQNIESAIAMVYRGSPDLSDYGVMRVLESLVDDFKGEKIGRPPRAVSLSELETSLKESIRAVCEWRLGRGGPKDFPAGAGGEEPAPVTVDEIVLCLKRIHKSAKFWTKERGPQGYLSFVMGYV